MGDGPFGEVECGGDLGVSRALREHDQYRRLRVLLGVAELEAAAQTGAEAGSELVELSDQRVLPDVGIYRYHHPLENAALYKERLAQLNTRIDEQVKAGKAVLAADMFTFNGSLARGRRMVADLSKLMLRAYQSAREFTREEIDALPILARGSALRFLLTRLYDRLNHPPGALVKPKDPLEYRQKLRFRAEPVLSAAKTRNPATPAINIARYERCIRPADEVYQQFHQTKVGSPYWPLAAN